MRHTKHATSRVPLLFALTAVALPFALSAAPPSPPTPSCSTSHQLFTTPGSHTFTVPPGVTSISVKMWGGAGGSGSQIDSWDPLDGYIGYGGGGGYAGGTISVTPNEQLSVTVGGGGKQWPGTGGFGGGGTSRTSGGGGYSGMFKSNIPLLIAGGGGGGIGGGTASGCLYRAGPYDGCSYFQGGAGGGLTGGNASIARGNGNGGAFATGGTQTAGGTGGGPYTGQSGSSLKGGDGLRSGGAGGGGYFGGGAGSMTDPAENMGYGSSGGGGSGYVAPSVQGNTTAGSGITPGNASDPDRPAGVAEGNNTSAGGSGAVYIEWDGGTGGSCNLSCSVTFDQNPLTGSATTMRWSSTGATLFFMNGTGYVPASGQSQVYSPGDYSGTVQDANGNTASCTAVLREGNGTNRCTPASTVCQANGNLRDDCGYITYCRFGCSRETNQCNTTCTPQRICNASGTRVIESCTGRLIEDCAARDYVCSAGQCIRTDIVFGEFNASDGPRAFRATGHLQVVPNLVRAGEKTRVYWNVQNAASCTVRGTNTDAWSSSFSDADGKLSSAIHGQTTYTLSCNALPGARPASISESVDINVIPAFQEL